MSIFSVLPSLPPVPAAISDGGGAITDFIAQGMSVIQALLSPALTVAVFTIMIAILAFEHIYHGILWILRKIPGLALN